MQSDGANNDQQGKPMLRRSEDPYTDTGEHTTIPIVLGSRQIAIKRRAKYRALAEKNRARRKLVAAERCFEKALYISMNILSSDNLQIATDLEQLATIAFERGKREAAEALMMRAKRIKDGFMSA